MPRTKPPAVKDDPTAWKGWFDGAAAPTNPGPRGVGALLVSPDGERFEISEATGFGTNNEAEYQAITALLEAAITRRVDNLIIYGDSQLVIYQIIGDWSCKSAGLRPFLTKAKALVSRIRKCRLHWIPREQNTEADVLSTASLGSLADEPVKKGRGADSEPSVWGTQSDIGKALQISAIAVGKLLDKHGLREDKKATPKAIKKGLARQYETHFGVKVDWHIAKTAEALGALS